jgi:hypothetical protein
MSTGLVSKSLTSGFPRKLITRLKYSQPIIITPAVPAYDYVFNLNSLYSPLHSGGGHQPLGYNQISAVYGKYRVFKVKWHMTAVANDATGQTVTVVPNNDPTSYSSDTDTAREAPYSKFKTCFPGGPALVMGGSVSLPKVLGRTSLQYKDDDITGAPYNSSPVEVCVLHVIFNSTDNAVNLNIQAQFQLVYYAEFYDQFALTAS